MYTDAKYTAFWFNHRSPDKRLHMLYFIYYDDSMCSRLSGDLWFNLFIVAEYSNL